MADSLANDDLKYIAYGLVFTKPGREQLMPFGEGSVVLKESLTDTNFLSFLIAKYLEDVAAQKDGQAQLDKVIRSPGDWKYVKAHFVVTASWDREPVHGHGRGVDALERLSARLREGS